MKAHLIPKSLTRMEEPARGFIQSGMGERPSRRWDSWYDRELVVQDGENILTALDTWAVPQLRKHHLVWSGWGPMLQLTNHMRIPGTDWGVRDIEGIDPVRLRLFFASLLWRAAASTRREFAEIELAREDLGKLREMLISGDPNPLSFYPVQLTQLSTRGEAHNQTPYASLKTIPSVGGSRSLDIPIYRFYFDGLIAHFHRHASDDGETQKFADLVVGASNRLRVTTVPYETSRELTNLRRIQLEAFEKWPTITAKLIGRTTDSGET